MSTTRCPQCGLLDFSSIEFCKRCKTEFGPVLSGTDQRFNESSPDHYAAEDFLAGESPIQPFTGVGSVLSPTLNLFTKNFVLIASVILVIVAPVEMLSAATIGNETSFIPIVFVVLTGMFCKALAAPALIYSLVVLMDTGKAPALGEAYRWSMSRIVPLILCSIVGMLAVFAATLLLIIPGIILGLAFIIAYPVVVLEGGSPIAVLRRSYNLTNGYKWRIFGALIVISMLTSIVSGSISMVAFASGAPPFWPVAALTSMATEVVGALQTVFTLVVYLSLVKGEKLLQLESQGIAAGALR
jgi:uncharacterized membrane protein